MPQGWEWVNESNTKRPKWGYVSTAPGSVLRLKVDTRVLSFSVGGVGGGGGGGTPGQSDAAKVGYCMSACGTEGQKVGQREGRVWGQECWSILKLLVLESVCEGVWVSGWVGGWVQEGHGFALV